MKFSIITPTYNNVDTIERAIRSIICQTYQNYEIIIIDDGSSDGTEEVVKKYLTDKIKYIKLNQNSGVNKARNIGLDNISNDSNFVTFLDSDDIFLEDALETMERNILKNSNYKVYGFGVKDHDGNKYSFLSNSIKSITYQDLLCNISISGEWVYCMRTDLIYNKIFRYEEKVKNGAEGIAYLELIKKYPFIMINEVVRVYYTNNESLTRVKNITQKKAKELILGYELFLKRNDSSLCKKKFAPILATLAKFYYYAGEKKLALFTTLKAMKLNILELRVYRNFLLFLGVKL